MDFIVLQCDFSPRRIHTLNRVHHRLHHHPLGLWSVKCRHKLSVVRSRLTLATVAADNGGELEVM